MRLLVIALALALPGAALAQEAPGEGGEVLATARPPSPADPAARLATAKALAADPARADEAAAALAGLLGDPALGAEAADALEALLLSRPPRAAWAGVTLALLGTPGRGNDLTLQLRYAASLARSPGLPQALSRLAALAGRAPEVALVRADALLRAAQPEEALAALEGTGSAAGSPGAAQPWASELPAGRLAAAAWLGLGEVRRAREAAGAETLPGCRAPGDAAACARYLAGAGYDELASGLLSDALLREGDEALSDKQAAAVLVAMGEQELAAGLYDAAARAFRKALDRDPGDDRARAGLAWAQLGAGNLGAAMSSAPAGDAALQGAIYALPLVQVPDPTLEEIDRAVARAGSHPDVLTAAVTAYVDARPPRWGDAMAALGGLLAQSPADRALLGRAIDLGLGGREPGFAVEALRAGLAATDDVGDWAALTRDLAALLAARAESRKVAGDLTAALEDYALALTLDPTSAALAAGLGGVLWDAGRLEDADSAFALAARLSPPGDIEAVLLRAELLESQGRTDDALAALKAAGLGDPRALELYQQLSAARTSRAALERDQPEEALAAWEALIARYPKVARFRRNLGNTLLALDRPEEALAAYEGALVADPKDAWSALGRANALMAMGDLNAAEAALQAMPRDLSPSVLREQARARRALLQARADALRAGRRDEEAYALYRELLEEAPDDTWALCGVGELYLLHGQPAAALVAFEAAGEAAPGNPEARSGQVRALILEGELAEARRRLDEALADGLDTSAGGSGLSGPKLEVLIAAARIARAQRGGDTRRALEIAEEALAAHPHHPDLIAAWAGLTIEDDPRAAFTAASAVLLYQDPTHEGALGALLSAANAMGRPGDALSYLEIARDQPVSAWVGRAEATVVLQLDLAALLARYRAGDREAVSDLERLTAAQPPLQEGWAAEGQAALHRRMLIAAAWLEVGDPDRAAVLFAEAQALSPEDPDAVIGLAGAWSAGGDHAEARQLLEAHWRSHHNPRVGMALAEHHARQGHYAAARRTLDEVNRYRRVVLYDRSLTAPAPLPLDPLPGGRSLAAQDDTLPTRILTVEDLERARSATENPDPVDADFGGAWIWRPEPPEGGAQLQALVLPVGAEVYLADPLRLEVEATPTWVTSGADTQLGSGLAVGLATPGLGAPLSARATVGLSPVGFDYGAYLTGQLAGRLTLLRGLELHGALVRAPATQSLLAWAGSADLTGATYGRVSDRWLEAMLVAYSLDGAEAGAAARSGRLDGAQIAAPVGWRQLQGWARAPWNPHPTLRLHLGADAQVVTHEVWIGGYTPGQGGVFTPGFYFSAAGSAALTWRPRDDSAALCGGAEIGPQYVEDVGALGLDTGLRFGSQLYGAGRLSLSESLQLMGGVFHQNVWAGWQQNTALFQLRYGHRDAGGYPPGGTASSTTHGVPLQYPGACWDRVPRAP
jgi:tetratricopeptide (TPR) repeat protein